MKPVSARKSPKTPGIREIALRLGVSIGTVSRALNNRYGINAQTRERVLEEARRIDYVPNQAARQLKDHPSLRVAFFFSPFRAPDGEINPAALNTIQEFERRSADFGMSSRVFFFSPGEFEQQLQDANVAVFYGVFDPSVRAIAHARGVPAVFLQQYPGDYPRQVALRVDTRRAGAAGVEYLAALGHERIGIVLSPLTEPHSAAMLTGYREALREFGLPGAVEWICELPSGLSNRDGGAQAMTRLMQLSPRPTAVLFASDWMAAGALQAAQQLGLRVPEDASLVGFDNLPISAGMNPPLTTFDVHLEKEVEILLQIVEDVALQRWEDKRPGVREVLLTPDLIRRHSCTFRRPPKP